MLKKILLGSGVLSSVLYVGIDLLAALRYPAYHSFTSQAISELGAVGAPTQALVSPLFLLYGLLLLAFAVGVWISAGGNHRLRLIGYLLLGITLIGGFTPPMQLRGTGTLSADAPHLIGTAGIVACILIAVGAGASLYGQRFRVYSIATLAVLVVSFVLTGVAAVPLAAGQPSPWLGLIERIHLGAYLLWVLVLGLALLRAERSVARSRGDVPHFFLTDPSRSLP